MLVQLRCERGRPRSRRCFLHLGHDGSTSSPSRRKRWQRSARPCCSFTAPRTESPRSGRQPSPCSNTWPMSVCTCSADAGTCRRSSTRTSSGNCCRASCAGTEVTNCCGRSAARAQADALPETRAVRLRGGWFGTTRLLLSTLLGRERRAAPRSGHPSPGRRCRMVFLPVVSPVRTVRLGGSCGGLVLVTGGSTRRVARWRCGGDRRRRRGVPRRVDRNRVVQRVPYRCARPHGPGP